MKIQRNESAHKRAGSTAVVITVSVLAVLASCLGDRQARAMPMFARRYGVPCSACHTSPPRLNETGYRFRAAGFRMPEELGQKTDEKSRKITNHIGFRLQPRYLVTHTSVGDQAQTKQDVNLFAAEGYFWYGPISPNLSANLKVTFWPDESNETELSERIEGTIRFDYGKADNFVDFRAGVPHPNEGFGGSEYYEAADTRPFIKELRTANFNQDTFFTPLGFHMMGATVGYYHKRTTIRGQLLSGMRVKEEADGTVEPFGRKEPFTGALPPSNKGGPDFQLFFNQILHPDGGNVSVYYYNGRSYLPRLDLLPASLAVNSRASAESAQSQGFSDLRVQPPSDPLSQSVAAGAMLHASATPAEIANLPFFKNTFHRLAFFAGYPIKRVRLLYGIQGGRDQIGAGGHFNSLGNFAEAMVKAFNDISVVGVRYDWFDPARNKDHNEINGITAYVNVWFHSELRMTPEFQHIVFRQGPGQLSQTQNRFQLRFYWIR